MRAAVFRGHDHPFVVTDVPTPQPVKAQVLVRIRAAALNRRDILIRQEQAVGEGQGIILGSDGCGIVEAAGEEVDPGMIGKEVVINPSLEWGKDVNVQGDKFRILGFPDHGTFAEYVLVPSKHVHEKPAHLTDEEAAALPLSSLTAYRALFTKARVRPGESVLVTGIGGGTAIFALQLAHAFNAKVFVTSSSADKLGLASKLGAVDGFNYKEEDWVEKAKRVTRGFHVIIDSAGGSTFPQLLDLARPGGRVVIFGRTAGSVPEFAPRMLFWKQLSVFGTTMGTPDEFMSVLDFIEKRKITPVIDCVLPLEQVEEGMKIMEEGRQFGKIVLRCGASFAIGS